MDKNKTAIDKEIKQLHKSLNELTDALPSYVPEELKELRDIILNVHSLLDTAMESCIFYEIDKSYGLNIKTINTNIRANRLLSLQPILNSLTFREKIRVIKNHKHPKGELIKTLQKVNEYRNSFAHPKELELKSKFNNYSLQGKENIKKLLKCLTSAIKEMESYFKENYIENS